MSKSKLIAEWEAARDDLGIEIVAPYEVDLGNNIKFRAEVLVKNFGGEKGMLIVTDYNAIEPYAEQLVSLGYGWSVLEEPTEPYNREIFIHMLSEWEWTGDEARKPHWIQDLPLDSEDSG